MNFEMVKAWLERQTSKRIQTRWMLAFLGIFLTPFGLAAGAFLVFMIAFLLTKESHDPGVYVNCLWVALGSIPVLFIINRFMPRSTEPEKYYHDDPDTSLVGSYVERRKVQMRFFLWVLFTGPRLVDWVIFSFREIHRLKKQDTHSCAAVLWLVLVKGKRVSDPDIRRELDWLDLDTTLPQLAWIPGLLRINTPPGAVSLTEDLRTAIREGKAP